ncbi:nucleotidyl transferase AbiEii/AbiGii toxin family protein [Paludibaculum fermentans]|uniref:nucleotidyl transferase AbiEii/AbiGii toxin family protein n=1 Tax=Paludibaculum fermentans TaxID=1473598 RepID=UPI003EB700AD
MNRAAHLPTKDLHDLFSNTAASLGIRPAIVEKDFWVCFVLKKLFVESAFRSHLVFKGGTSLSKVYGLIQRFSEDIDLVLDWRLLGLALGFNEERLSKTQQDKLNKNANQLAGEFIARELCPELNRIFQDSRIGISAAMDEKDPQVVNIAYPAAFTEAYLRPEVRLEIGPLASWVPSANHRIQPYAADVFPNVFDDPACPVLAIAAERTFWEKATILHQEAHREGLIPTRHSRHYYDLCKLAMSPVRDAALANLNLLRDVVEFKQHFYPSRWALYHLALPGSFKLLPAGTGQLRELEQDYEQMQMMLFGDPPSFPTMLATLAELERDINALESAPH